MKLKGVILSLDNVVFHNSRLDPAAFEEVGRFVKFLMMRGVTPVVVANTTRRMTAGGTLQARIDQDWGAFPWYVAEEGTGGWKPRAEAVDRVLVDQGWERHQVALLGNQEDDMRTAVNGKVLFLNAEWFAKGSNYGLRFQTVKEIARFIDLCCLREHPWFFAVQGDGLYFSALSPYATRINAFANYSNDALASLKQGAVHKDFWVKYLCASIYFSGLSQGLNYLAPYPGHKQGSGSANLDEALMEVATCFGMTYTRDLIIRHTEAPKSAWDRAGADHLRQFNTIRLNRTPLKSLGQDRYKNSPLKSGRTVLVVDDICTQGYSLEAARHYLRQTGAEAVCVSFLKTVSRDYHELVDVPKFDPYRANQFTPPLGRIVAHGYQNNIVDRDAPEELDAALREWDTWDWPA